MSTEMLCPLCRERCLPPQKPRGRPRAYCGDVCSNRARLRKRQAAALLERADSLERHVGNASFGSAEYVQRQVDGLRARARACERAARCLDK